jgi:glycolate oxidase FAD binding subunit
MEIEDARASLAAAGVQARSRAGVPEQDAIDGLTPGVVVEPETPEEAAATLAWAASRRLTLVIRGSGSKHAWGRAPGAVDAVMSLARLNRVLEHEAGDLTVTVEGGTTLRDLNLQLGTRGQWLPLDPPFADRATVGGLLATNDSGPHRHRFGTPRDLVIGIRLATTDGRVTRAGGKVVKNVAGYDLARLASGSFGELAAIVAVTFKLLPVAAASHTILVEAHDAAALAGIAARVASSQLEPVAFEVQARRGPDQGPIACLLRFASFAEALEAQVAAAVALLSPLSAAIRTAGAEAEAEAWRQHQPRFLEAPGAVLRASWLPADLEQVLSLVDEVAAEGAVELIGRVVVGAGLLRVEGGSERQAAVIARLRASPLLGNVVVARATPALKSLVDVWGPQPNARLLAAIKRTLDPGGTLGAGRGPR